MLAELSPQEVHDRMQAGTLRLIDIREPDEYRALSVAGAELMPLSTLGRYPLKDTGLPVVFTCRSGRRTRDNAALLASLVQGRAFMMRGGLDAWHRDGLPVDEDPAYLPLFRQIQMGAGVLILAGVLGSLLWPPLLWLAGLAGAGLLLAGITGFCGLGILLQRMPWNRRSMPCACGRKETDKRRT